MNKAGSTISVEHNEGKNLSSAKKAASRADSVIVVTGRIWKDEGEGHDCEHLDLTEKQVKLIDAVAGVTQRCIVVLEAGTAVTMRPWKDKVEAIVMAWYPGMEGGKAIADILFGDVNPSGKLPLSIPKSEDQLWEFDSKADAVTYDYYQGYRYFDKRGIEPEFHFGFGMSYTEYKYDNLRLDKKKINKNGIVTAKVDVTNVGRLAGEEIVQLYVGYNGSSVDRPVKELKGFTKIKLAPGESKTVALEVKACDLSYYNASRSVWEVEEIEYLVYAGPSSRKEDLLSDTFRVSG